MPGRVTIYTLGQKGVNVNRSPLHIDDEEVTQAQNAVWDTSGTEGALTMRGGLQRLNSATALNGSITTCAPVNFTAKPTKYLMHGLEVTTGSNTFRRSTDGTTWAYVTSPSKVQQAIVVNLASPSYSFADNVGAVYLNGFLFYLGHHIAYPTALATAPVIRVYDPVTNTDNPFVTLPNSGAVGTLSRGIVALGVHLGTLYCTTWDGGAGTDSLAMGRVLQIDTDTGQMTEIGPPFISGTDTFRAIPWCLASYRGALWVGTNASETGTGNGRVFYIRPGIDATWTEKSFSLADGWVHSLVAFQGALYAGLCPAASPGTVRINKLASTGVWSTVFSEASTSGYAVATSLVVYGNALYAGVWQATGPVMKIITSTDGTTWTLDYNVEANFSGRRYWGQMLVNGSDLYCAIAEPGGTGTPGGSGGLLLKRTGGTWSKVDDISSRGFFAFYTT